MNELSQPITLHLKMTRFTSLAAAAVLGAPSLFGQNAGFEPFAPKFLPPGPAGTIGDPAPEVAPKTAPGEVLVEKITGIVLTGRTENLRESSQARGVRTLDFQPPAQPALEQSLAAHVGKPLTLAELTEICRVIVAHYREQGRPVVDAIVPEGQDVSNGVVQILVVEGKIGDVRLEGAKHFSSDLLRPQLRVGPGDAIQRVPLLADLAWLNSNPFRRSDVVFAPGEKFGTTDLILRTEDRFPLRVYTGVENTGVDSTGEDRFFAGFNYGNAFGLDHQWSGQFTGDSDFDRLRAWSSAYLAPLPWRHWLMVYGSYVESQPDLPAPFDQDGTNWEIGLAYRIPIVCSDALRHEWNFGYEFKRIDNNLQFGGIQVFDSAVGISQMLIGYEGSYTVPGSRTNWGATLYFSPGGIGGHAEDVDYERARPGADSTYAYLNARFGHEHQLPWNLTWKLDVESQAATGNLIGSEQLGVGGFRSVRGYREYELTGDDALIVRNELRGPAFSCLGRIGPVQDTLQPLVFADLGTAWKSDAAAGERNHATLASAGIGLRYSIDPWVTAYLDWGIQLRDSGANDPHSSAFHFGITGSF